MTAYDVFNGDADGLCALQQWRLADPSPSTLVTGVKRDIRLLRRVFPQPEDSVTVMDVSLDVNREDLMRILDSGAKVDLFRPSFQRLRSKPRGFPTPPERVPGRLYQPAGGWLLARRVPTVGDRGRFRRQSRRGCGASGGPLLDPARIEALRELGRLLNYNGYGRSVEDLHFPPDRLHERLRLYAQSPRFPGGG